MSLDSRLEEISTDVLIAALIDRLTESNALEMHYSQFFWLYAVLLQQLREQ